MRQGEHERCVVLDPPDVYDFAPHVEQAVDPAAALYALSRPQFWQTISPAPETASGASGKSVGEYSERVEWKSERGNGASVSERVWDQALGQKMRGNTGGPITFGACETNHRKLIPERAVCKQQQGWGLGGGCCHL